jgi:hypothetical protein
LARIDAYWRRRFACSEDELASGATVIRHFPAEPAHRFNVIALRRIGGGCAINVHDHLLEPIASLRGMAAAQTFDEDVLARAYAPARIELAISAAQAYADRTDLVAPSDSIPVRVLEGLDAPEFAAFRSSVTDADWSEASANEAAPPVCAVFDGSHMAAMAHAVDRGGLMHMGVLTAPGYRRRGYASAGAFAMASRVAADGAIVQWQARLSNTASIAVRDALGFVERYRTIALRVGGHA